MVVAVCQPRDEYMHSEEFWIFLPLFCSNTVGEGLVLGAVAKGRWKLLKVTAVKVRLWRSVLRRSRELHPAPSILPLPTASCPSPTQENWAATRLLPITPPLKFSQADLDSQIKIRFLPPPDGH